MFDLKNQELNPGLKYLNKGINQNVVIGQITAVEENTQSPAIYITLFRETGSIETSTKIKLSFTEKAKKWSLQKIMHMWDCFYNRHELEEIDDTSTNLTDFANKINKKLEGKMFDEFLFGVREYLNAENKLKFALEIPLPTPTTFAHMNKFGKSKLIYDETNPYIYKKAVIPDKETANDLPF